MKAIIVSSKVLCQYLLERSYFISDEDEVTIIVEDGVLYIKDVGDLKCHVEQRNEEKIELELTAPRFKRMIALLKCIEEQPVVIDLTIDYSITFRVAI